MPVAPRRYDETVAMLLNRLGVPIDKFRWVVRIDPGTGAELARLAMTPTHTAGQQVLCLKYAYDASNYFIAAGFGMETITAQDIINRDLITFS